MYKLAMSPYLGRHFKKVSWNSRPVKGNEPIMGRAGGPGGQILREFGSSTKTSRNTIVKTRIEATLLLRKLAMV